MYNNGNERMTVMNSPTRVRQATLRDAERVFDLINMNRDKLVPRSLGNIVENIDRFVIAEFKGNMMGCASYQIHPEIGRAESATVEIVSVAVSGEFRRQGVGRQLIHAILDEIRRFDPREAIVLTFAPAFFTALGFVEVSKTKVMHKLYTGCINCTKHADPFTCPEIAMVLSLNK